jgi:hypothetical protein
MDIHYDFFTDKQRRICCKGEIFGGINYMSEASCERVMKYIQKF